MKGAFSPGATGSVIKEVRRTTAAAIPDRTLRGIPGRHESWINVLIEFAETTVADEAIIGVPARAQDGGPSGEDDLLGLAACKTECRETLLGLDTGTADQEDQNKSYPLHGGIHRLSPYHP